MNTQSDSISAKTIYVNLSLSSCIFYVLSPPTVYIKLSNFSLFSVENDEMESSKRCVKLLSLIFIISCFTKSKQFATVYISSLYFLLSFFNSEAHEV